MESITRTMILSIFHKVEAAVALNIRKETVKRSIALSVVVHRALTIRVRLVPNPCHDCFANELETFFHVWNWSPSSDKLSCTRQESRWIPK